VLRWTPWESFELPTFTWFNYSASCIGDD